jgi:hypothetical protein
MEERFFSARLFCSIRSSCCSCCHHAELPHCDLTTPVSLYISHVGVSSSLSHFLFAVILGDVDDMVTTSMVRASQQHHLVVGMDDVRAQAGTFFTQF